MKKVVLGLTAAAALSVVPATAAPASEIPEINCGIVSCTYPIERQVDRVQDCVAAAEYAVRGIVNGTPQPGAC
jgi:hypothetical protein